MEERKQLSLTKNKYEKTKTVFFIQCGYKIRLIKSRLFVLENGSEQQLELSKDAFYHPSSSTFFSNGLCLMLWKNMMERLA
ncbi:MAG: hypothetical protein AB2693_32155 [Candidatus Thiodiazotropha sp.]